MAEMEAVRNDKEPTARPATGPSNLERLGTELDRLTVLSRASRNVDGAVNPHRRSRQTERSSTSSGEGERWSTATLLAHAVVARVGNSGR